MIPSISSITKWVSTNHSKILATYPTNYALSFDGVQDIVKIGHMYTDLGLSNTWTAEAWIKPFGTQSGQFQPNIIGFPQRHPNLELCGNSVQCDNPTKTLTQLREQNGQYFTMVGRNPLGDTTNTWYHISASWDNVTFTSYLNGEVDIQTMPYNGGFVFPKNCSFAMCDEGLDIGGYRFIDQTGNYFNGQFFTGLIDEVRVWNVGRTQAQIKSTMNTVLSGGEPGLLYYFRFDEGTGLLVNSLAFAAFGTLGGGIIASEPRWVQSDSPLTNPYPPPSPVPTPGGSVTCNSNESGLYATAAILSIVFIIVGAIVGILGFKWYQRSGNYNELK